MRIFFVILFVFSLDAGAQLRVVKPVKKTLPRKTNLSIGAGVARSVLFLERNVKENNDASGLTFYLLYGGANITRASLEYTFYFPIDINPTWNNIRANTFELNYHILARFKNMKAYFYPLFGLSYNHFSGYYTGKNDFMGLTQKYDVNSTVVTNWLGFNVGTGFETYYRSFSFFLDYKMRIGANNGRETSVNIMDVCFHTGLRYTLRVPSIYSIFSSTKSRYLLDVDKD